jgi:glucose-6-phosphate 1-dehydrogenase
MTLPVTHNLPTALVIFGGTGNLAETKLLPSLYNLYIDGQLPTLFTVIGLSRKPFDDAQYRAYVEEVILHKVPAADADTLESFLARVHYVSGSFDDARAYDAIKQNLQSFDDAHKVCTNKLFYLAVPPNLYSAIFKHLKESDAMKLCDGVASWSRLLVEKPFGSDLKTAEALEAQLCELFTEEQIYRIDHYLAKDTIENIISLRFANSILADSWNTSRIEHIHLRLFESVDVSSRGSFYDGIGALRDVGQNHMLQMLALLTMHKVDMRDAHSVRSARLAALRSLTMHDTDLKARGQYEGYADTPGVAAGSQTETYFKISTHIESELWENVSVTLESGKALQEAKAEAIITFRPTDTCMCALEEAPHVHKNVLSITFSPEQMITLSMWIKKPGFGLTLEKRDLVLTRAEGEVFRSPEAYERVLYDCIVGDQTRFVSGEEVAAAWNFITPILHAFPLMPLHIYKRGSSGPEAVTQP